MGQVELTNGRKLLCRFPRRLSAGSDTIVSLRPGAINVTTPGQPFGTSNEINRLGAD